MLLSTIEEYACPVQWIREAEPVLPANSGSGVGVPSDQSAGLGGRSHVDLHYD